MNRPTMERSVGLILIIPFGICFVLLFLVCCFADEMKKMCMLPSQIPPSYRSSSPVFNTSRRHESNMASSSRQNNRLDADDIENQSIAVEQAETEQLISDDFILASAAEIPAQISVRSNTLSSLSHFHQSTLNNNNNNNNNQNTNYQQHNDNDNNNNSNNENSIADSIQSNYQSNISRSSSSILLGNGVCINRPSQHSDYGLSRHLGDINGAGFEEAETSLIPPIIFRSSLQQLHRPNNSVNPDYPDILDHDIIASDLASSRSASAAASKGQQATNNPRQMEVSVSVNNLSTAHI